MAKAAHKVVRLPIAARSLDLNERTAPVQTVMCPARHDLITVGTCRQCREFRRVDVDAGRAEVVCSGSREAAKLQPSADRSSVQHKVRLPHVCASLDTSLSTLLPYADQLRPWEAIPVLDAQAKPVGILLGSELGRLSSNRLDPTVSVERVMSRSFTTVFPCMSLQDAAQLRARSAFRGVIVVSDDDLFLGVVSEPDLERARDFGPMQDTV